MKRFILIITLILMSLVGYNQTKSLGKISIGKINKEVKKADKGSIFNVVDYITDTRIDSIHGRIVSFYTLYSDGTIVTANKILIEHTSNGVDKLTKEEIYIKNNQVIYYKGYDYATGNCAEVYFKDYTDMIIKVNGKYCKPEIEVFLLFQNHIRSYIEFLQKKYE